MMVSTSNTTAKTMSPNGKRVHPTATPRRNRHANVIAAAIEVMSEKGYPATSIQEVADRVGVLKGSLYHYFPSKEELLVQILNESHQQNNDIMEAVQNLGLSAFEELLAYLRESARWYLANIDRANIFFSETKHLTGTRLEEAREYGRAYERYVQGLIRTAQNDGDIRDDIDDRLISRSVLGSINSVRFWPSRSGSQPFESEEIVDAFINLTRAAIQA